MKHLRLYLICAFLTALLFGQQALTNDSVIKLVKAGMGDDVVVNMIDTQPGNFAVGVDDLIALKSAGVSDKVIAAMVVRKNGAPVGASISAPAGPVHEVGVYYKKGIPGPTLNLKLSASKPVAC